MARMAGGGTAPSASRRKASSIASMQTSGASRGSTSARESSRACGISAVHPDRGADRLPAGVSAIHVLRVESRLAQLDRCLAADVESVGAIHHHGLRLGQLADPLLALLGIAPRGAVREVLLTGDEVPRAHVDDLHLLPGTEHRLHLLNPDTRQVAEFGLHQR